MARSVNAFVCVCVCGALFVLSFRFGSQQQLTENGDCSLFREQRLSSVVMKSVCMYVYVCICVCVCVCVYVYVCVFVCVYMVVKAKSISQTKRVSRGSGLTE